ncbi:MAG TPA: CdaR family protein [Candidatus Sulfotelmatobacter sp.]|jgi:YbbR domain-containing protein|nr:CdaR family protein [Candidatus Sulfotelmatobacter sp.]
MIGFVKRYVFHNFGLKVISLILATGLWFIISRDEQPAEIALRSPIVFQHVPSNLEISSESVPEALIRVRGPERVIRGLKANEIQAEIDLAGSKPQDRTFDLTAQQVRHPREVAVMQIVPSQVRLSFDTRLTKEVEVHPRVTGIPSDEDFKVQAEPARITIVGPQRRVEKIDAATTDPVDATGTHGSAVFTTSVSVADPLVQVEQPTAIRVTVFVQKAAGQASH